MSLRQTADSFYFFTIRCKNWLKPKLRYIASPLGDKYCSAGRQPWVGMNCYLLWCRSGACRSVR